MLFRVSNRTHDGLLFLGKLASRYGDRKPLTVEEAAGRVISPGYLEQIACVLRQAGLIAGRRGPGGGYLLARSPDKISVRQAVEALEGRINMVDCQESACPERSACGSRDLWDLLQKKISATLEQITLKEIAESNPTHPPLKIRGGEVGL